MFVWHASCSCNSDKCDALGKNREMKLICCPVGGASTSGNEFRGMVDIHEIEQRFNHLYRSIRTDLPWGLDFNPSYAGDKHYHPGCLRKDCGILIGFAILLQ